MSTIDRSVIILSALSSEKFGEDLEKALIDLLAKHINRDITGIEASSILELFKIGRERVDRERRMSGL